MDQITSNRLAKLAWERTPPVVQAEREKIEAGYAAESAFRKQLAEANLPRWAAIRAARGQGKRR